MELNWGIFITSAILLLVIYYITKNNIVRGLLFPSLGTTVIRSRIDGELYTIQDGLPDKQGAADMLGKIHLITVSLIHYMKINHPTNPLTVRLLLRYNPNKKTETHPINSDDSTSFTLNKESFSFCLRDKNTKKIHSLSTISFVVLHEIAHQADLNIGHSPGFWTTFKTILVFAKAANLYIPIDYSITPITYCGMVVSYNPYFDASINLISDVA